MKKAAEAEDGVVVEEALVDGEEEDLINVGSEDICKTLMERYSKSSAPQHQHLCASAAAMRSILLEEGLPLSPAAYFAAAITAIRESDYADREAMTALSAFLSLLLPLIPVQSMHPMKARDAASSIVSILHTSSDSLATPTVRSLVKSLGFLLLCVDLDDWTAVKSPLKTLFEFTVDRRPKVRRCAQVSIKKGFDSFRKSIVLEKASKVILSLHKRHIPLAMNLCARSIPDESSSSIQLNSEHMEVLHVLNVIKLTAPTLSKKIIMKVSCDISKLLGCQFSLYTRHVLSLLEVLLEYSEGEVLIPEAENILVALTSYLSLKEKNPIDTILFASTLLKIWLNKLRVAQPSMWISNLPLIFISVAGLLNFEADISKQAAVILKELINSHIDRGVFQVSANQSIYDRIVDTSELKAIESICNLFETMLCGSTAVPNEHILSVISVLFHKLGEFSYFFMKGTVLKLSEWAMDVERDMSNAKHIEECLGCAVTAMGPEKFLSLIPISLHAENLTCSNAWLIPILKKHATGSTLQYFMQHIVPLAKSIQETCSKVTKSVRKSVNIRHLLSCAHDLWDLLPAFCHYPTDTSQTFDSLAKLLVLVLREDPSLHETVTKSVKELVSENRNVLSVIEDVNIANQSTGFMINGSIIASRNVPPHYSKKVASRNIKALASSSMELFQALVDVFFDSPPQRGAHLKEAIGCLASIHKSSNVQNIFMSLLEKFDLKDTFAEPKSCVSHHILPTNCTEQGRHSETEKYEEQRCKMMDLVSSFVEGADKDFVNMMFSFIKPSLLDTVGVLQSTTFYTLSAILKEHSWFCSVQIDELMDLLLSSKSPVDSTILRARFSCLQFLLVHLLKTNEENIDTKAFLILNEIILSLKDSNKEVRKSAYDLLLKISCSLKDSNSGSPLHQLFTMIIGYFSGSSPHIMSGAVAALSVLLYKDSGLCLCVPNLIPSVLVLLQNKASEVTKAVLGFVKVLVSCLHAIELKILLPDIVNATLPWSSVSKNHFRTKVRIILEIMMRKCGTNSIDVLVPEKYRAFVKTIEEQRHIKTGSKAVSRSEAEPKPVDSSMKRGKKRTRENFPSPTDKAQPGASNGASNKSRKKMKSKRVDSTNDHSQNTEGTGMLVSRSGRSDMREKTQSGRRGENKRHAGDWATGIGKKAKNEQERSKSSNYAASVPRSAATFKSNKRGRRVMRASKS